MNVGQFDQMKEAMKDLSALLFDHYSCMLKAGFDPKQALQLTIGFQGTFFPSSSK